MHKHAHTQRSPVMIQGVKVYCGPEAALLRSRYSTRGATNMMMAHWSRNLWRGGGGMQARQEQGGGPAAFTWYAMGSTHLVHTCGIHQPLRHASATTQLQPAPTLKPMIKPTIKP